MSATKSGIARPGHAHAYGTVAPVVRRALADEGVIEPTSWARKHGLSSAAVASALKEEAKRGRAVRLFKAYFYPATAEHVLRGLESWRKR